MFNSQNIYETYQKILFISFIMINQGVVGQI